MLLSVIIPVYNEEKTIREIVEKVKRVTLPKEIVIVDDGSRDSTRAILDAMEAEAEKSSDPANQLVIIHQKNGGKGSALKTGITIAKGDIIIFQDADLECDPGDYYALIEPIASGEVQTTMGSRFTQKQNIWVGGMPTPRYFLNHLGVRFIVLLTNLLYWNNATDYEGCYKAFAAELLKSLSIEANGFEIDNEIICKILRMGVKIKEAPIHYYPRSYEEGKKIKAKDGLKILWAIVKWRFKGF